MTSILMAVGCAAAYLIAYHTYGKFLARKIFHLDDKNVTPAHVVDDGVDYVATKKEILFGHHYTSIAGTGPIVGPAIGIIWGWLPALLWVVLGSIFMGAVHDFGSIVVSMRHQGKSIGDIAGGLISPRVRVIFLLIIALLLTIVIAVFCLVMAGLFSMFPESVLSIWVQIPIAVALGWLVYKKNLPALPLSLAGLVLLYLAMVIGAYKLPLELPDALPLIGTTPVVTWTVILLIYAFVASTLPVTRLLQPRDYINGHQLFVVMGALALGVLFSRPEIIAPSVRPDPPGAMGLWPFLFITIACGAISGFHSLVASGTTAKQIGSEQHARTIGYGGMLLEGMLAVFVIIAVAGGIGLIADGAGRTGAAAWNARYADWKTMDSLGAKVGVFVNGSANMLSYLGIPLALGTTIMGVFVVSFAGTTLDTAMRLQRYVVGELAGGLNIKPLTNKYAATTVAAVSAGLLALGDGKGKGGMALWPMFGASNQLLGALALLVITVYLARLRKPMVYTFVPFSLMLVMTGWAMIVKIGQWYGNYRTDGSQLHLLLIGGAILILELWMVVEAAVVMWRATRGTLESAEAA